MAKRFFGLSLTAIASLAMSLLLLSACGRNDADGIIEISFLHVFTGARGDLINTLAAEFNQQSNGRYKVTPVFVAGSYEGLIERMMLLSLTNDLPELVHSGHNYVQFLSDNFPVIPIQYFVDRDGHDVSDIFPRMLDLGRDDSGQIVGMPWHVSTGILAFNANIFEANGISEPPRTFDEMRSIAQTLTGDGIYGVYLEYEMTGLGVIQSLVEGFGGQMLSDDRRSMGFGEAGLLAFKFLNDLVNTDGTMPLVSMLEAQQMFVAGRIGMYLTSTGNIRAMQNESQFTVLTAPHPTIDGILRSIPSGGASTFILSSDQQKQEIAWEFVKFISTPEVATRIAQTWGSLVTSQHAFTTPELMGNFIRDDPAAAATYLQAPYISQFFNFPGTGGTRYVEIAQNNIAAMLQRQITPVQAFLDTETRLNDLIAQAQN